MMSITDTRGFRVFAAYAVAFLVAYMLAAIATTQWMLGGMVLAGDEVTATQRLVISAQDLLSMLPTYGLIVAATMALALAVAAAVSHRVPMLRGVGLVAAGAVGVMGANLIARQVLGETSVTMAETTGGVLAQGLAGGVGGYLYYLMRRS